MGVNWVERVKNQKIENINRLIKVRISN